MSIVTILLSTFNGAAFIDEQLQSIVNQTMTDWKLVVRDDNSSDQTVAIVERYAQTDDRITHLPLDGVNKGPAKSFLEMLPLVATPYFAFADQDDVWMPDKLRNSLSVMQMIEVPGAPCAVFGDAVLIRADGSVRATSALATRRGARPSQVTFGELLLQNVVMGGTLLGNKTLAGHATGVDANLAPMHDWACALIAKGGGVLDYQPSRDLLHRQHDDNVTGLPEHRRDLIAHSVDGGITAWAHRVMQPATRMAVALASVPTVAGQEQVTRLAQLSPDRLTARSIRTLRRGGIRLQPGWRQLVLLLVTSRKQ